MTTFKSSGQVALDNAAREEHAEAVRKSEERAELREALLRKLARPTKLAKAEAKLTTEEAILATLQEINRKLGTPAEDNARYLTQRAMGVKPSQGTVPMAPSQDHLNAADAPNPLLAEWLKGRIL